MLQSGAVARCPGVYEFLGAVPSERTDGRQGYRANHKRVFRLYQGAGAVPRRKCHRGTSR